jgi:cephalosporin-C deacetylase-like acetyl esterase
VRTGYHAAVIIRKDFSFNPETVMDDAEKEFRSLVMRSRQALDWLAAQDEVDESRLATFGVSAGGIISACLAGADPRPSAHVLVLAGGPLADVLLDTEEDRFNGYFEELREKTGWTDAKIREGLREAIRTDPIQLASRVPRESVLMFIARNDESVPTSTGVALWRAVGGPELRWLPFGHYWSFLAQPWIQVEANRFLRAKLGPP